MPGLNQFQPDICIVVNDNAIAKSVRDLGHTHNHLGGKSFNINHAKNIFVVCNSSGLEFISDIIRQANNTHKLRAILVREDKNMHWITRILEKANLRTLRNLLVHSGSEVPRRVLTAWKYEQEEQLIADAAVFDDKLMVLDCAMNSYEVPFSSIKSLNRLRKAERDQFAIAEDGSHIHWPGPDIHLDIETIQNVLDPQRADRAKAKAFTQNQWFGKAIAEYRKSNQLRQEDIAGISDRQLRRIESGEHASVKSLALLAKAHNLSLNDYLNNIAEIAQKVKRRKI